MHSSVSSSYCSDSKSCLLTGKHTPDILLSLKSIATHPKVGQKTNAAVQCCSHPGAWLLYKPQSGICEQTRSDMQYLLKSPTCTPTGRGTLRWFNCVWLALLVRSAAPQTHLGDLAHQACCTQHLYPPRARVCAPQHAALDLKCHVS